MELIFLLGGLVLLGLLLFVKRKKLIWNKYGIFYFCMYRTKVGIKLMEKIVSKHRKTIKILGNIGIVFGFIGMVLVFGELIYGIYLLFTNPAITVGLVLPIKAKGVFYVPVLYWIISVLVVMIVHEGGHGIVAIAHKLKIKATGMAFLGVIIPIIPAAFVEPNEKELMKQKNKVKLSVFAAGAFANIIFGFICLFMLSVLLVPVFNVVFEPSTTTTLLGSQFQINKVIRPEVLLNHPIVSQLVLYTNDLLYWLILLNWGVGLFNLVPIGPIDGGRMFQIVLEKIIPKKKAIFVWKSLSYVLVLVIVSNILYALLG